MEQIIILPEESQYNEILRQAVAFIESSRSRAASAVVRTSNEMHWEIGTKNSVIYSIYSSHSNRHRRLIFTALIHANVEN